VTAPATPTDVIRELSNLTRELRDTTSALKSAEHDAAIKRHAADMAESRAFLSAEGAMELRKHQARVAADRPEGEALVAEALVRVLRARIREIETRIDVGRTYGATIRAELKTIGYQDGA
jgi:hypothetical protein